MLIGTVLGLLGGGGSILTVPVLVYLLAVPAVEATAYSLFVVGLAAAVGAVGYIRAGHVDLKVALVFALPSLVAVFLTRRFLVPAIPDPVFSVGDVAVARSTLIMVLFAVTMLLAAISMIRGCIRCVTRSEKESPASEEKPLSIPSILIEGAVVGTLTGLVGAGGGFLIIPALVLIGGLPMKQAVGTSLVIIAVKSLIGFAGDVAAATTLDWGFLLPFAGATVVGIIVGMVVSRLVESQKLRPVFGWFVLGMGAFITIEQVVAITALS
jgi:hypothetical protein